MSFNFSRLRNPELVKLFNDFLTHITADFVAADAVVTSATDTKLLAYARCIDLGTPIVGTTTNRIVTSTNMKVGEYTIANQPDVCRNITVTATAVGAADTMGTVTITGTDIAGAALTETITPVAGSTVAGSKCFETVTSVVGADWVIGEGNDTIVVGVGQKLGLPLALSGSRSVPLGINGTTITAVTATYGGTLATSNVQVGVYNGTNRIVVFVIE